MMTAPKLTPAEALDHIRAGYHPETMGRNTKNWKAFAALEEALARLAALEAKPVEQADSAALDRLAKAWAGHVLWMADLEAQDKARLEKIKAMRPVEPAQPVPSDEEICKEIREAFREAKGWPMPGWFQVIRLICQRIGVKL